MQAAKAAKALRDVDLINISASRTQAEASIEAHEAWMANRYKHDSHRPASAGAMSEMSMGQTTDASEAEDNLLTEMRLDKTKDKEGRTRSEINEKNSELLALVEQKEELLLETADLQIENAKHQARILLERNESGREQMRDYGREYRCPDSSDFNDDRMCDQLELILYPDDVRGYVKPVLRRAAKASKMVENATALSEDHTIRTMKELGRLAEAALTGALVPPVADSIVRRKRKSTVATEDGEEEMEDGIEEEEEQVGSPPQDLGDDSEATNMLAEQRAKSDREMQDLLTNPEAVNAADGTLLTTKAHLPRDFHSGLRGILELLCQLILIKNARVLTIKEEALVVEKEKQTEQKVLRGLIARSEGKQQGAGDQQIDYRISEDEATATVRKIRAERKAKDKVLQEKRTADLKADEGQINQVKEQLLPLMSAYFPMVTKVKQSAAEIAEAIAAEIEAQRLKSEEQELGKPPRPQSATMNFADTSDPKPFSPGSPQSLVNTSAISGVGNASVTSAASTTAAAAMRGAVGLLLTSSLTQLTHLAVKLSGTGDMANIILAQVALTDEAYEQGLDLVDGALADLTEEIKKNRGEHASLSPKRKAAAHAAEAEDRLVAMLTKGSDAAATSTTADPSGLVSDRPAGVAPSASPKEESSPHQPVLSDTDVADVEWYEKARTEYLKRLDVAMLVSKERLVQLMLMREDPTDAVEEAHRIADEEFAAAALAKAEQLRLAKRLAGNQSNTSSYFNASPSSPNLEGVTKIGKRVSIQLTPGTQPLNPTTANSRPGTGASRPPTAATALRLKLEEQKRQAVKDQAQAQASIRGQFEKHHKHCYDVINSEVDSKRRVIAQITEHDLPAMADARAFQENAHVAAMDLYAKEQIESINHMKILEEEQQRLWVEVEEVLERNKPLQEERHRLVEENLQRTEIEWERRRHYDEWVAAHDHHRRHLEALQELLEQANVVLAGCKDVHNGMAHSIIQSVTIEKVVSRRQSRGGARRESAAEEMGRRLSKLVGGTSSVTSSLPGAIQHVPPVPSLEQLDIDSIFNAIMSEEDEEADDGLASEEDGDTNLSDALALKALRVDHTHTFLGKLFGPFVQTTEELITRKNARLLVAKKTLRMCDNLLGIESAPPSNPGGLNMSAIEDRRSSLNTSNLTAGPDAQIQGEDCDRVRALRKESLAAILTLEREVLVMARRVEYYQPMYSWLLNNLEKREQKALLKAERKAVAIRAAGVVEPENVPADSLLMGTEKSEPQLTYKRYEQLYNPEHSDKFKRWQLEVARAVTDLHAFDFAEEATLADVLNEVVEVGAEAEAKERKRMDKVRDSPERLRSVPRKRPNSSSSAGRQSQ